MTLALMTVIPFIVAVQVIRLGLLENDELRKIGERQARTEIEIPALRGTIRDAANRVLADDRVREIIVIDPTVDGFQQNLMRHYAVLSKATGLSVNTIDRRVRGRESKKYLVLSRDVTLNEDTRSAVQKIPGVSIRKEFSRHYNYGRSGPHVRGYVDIDMKGLEGVEKQYDEILSGKPGRRVAIRDRRGVRKMLPGGKVIEPQHGESIKLTINIVHQTIMEEELASGSEAAGATWSSAIALDPFTGAILAMANYPSYDLNHPAGVPTVNRKNRSIVNRFEPGSTFKLIAAVTAIETGVVAMSDTFDTGAGYDRIAGWPVRDTRGHGRIPFTEVISLSSNIGFAQLSEDLDHGAYYQYARALGFGQTLGIDLPGEVSGKLIRPSSWSGSTLSSMSRGYGIDATALQLLVAYSALANGGLVVKPFIVSERFDHAGNTVWKIRPDSIRRAFSRETAATLLPAFENVVISGTARTAQLRGVRVAGKTGTAKKAANGSYSSGKYRASFVGFFPAENPRVAMIVVMDEPRSSIYGGHTAAPVFQKIAERWIPLFPDIQRTGRPVDLQEARSEQDSEKDAAAEVTAAACAPGATDATCATAAACAPGAADPMCATEVTMRISDAANFPAEIARRRLSLLNVQNTISGMEGRHDSNEKIETTGMPDLIGMGARDASFILALRGIRVRLEGNGRVVSQSPLPGKKPGENVLLRLR